LHLVSESIVECVNALHVTLRKKDTYLVKEDSTCMHIDKVFLVFKNWSPRAVFVILSWRLLLTILLLLLLLAWRHISFFVFPWTIEHYYSVFSSACVS